MAHASGVNAGVMLRTRVKPVVGWSRLPMPLFLVQSVTARMRRQSDTIEAVMQNTPVILMRNGQIIESALAETRVARSDLMAKLREANVLDIQQVKAVVLETTGDISVLHGHHCADEILEGTRSIPS